MNTSDKSDSFHTESNASKGTVDREKLSALIVRAAEACGSQKMLSRLSGISIPQLSRIRNGHYETAPNRLTLDKIAAATNAVTKRELYEAAGYSADESPYSVFSEAPSKYSYSSVSEQTASHGDRFDSFVARVRMLEQAAPYIFYRYLSSSPYHWTLSPLSRHNFYDYEITFKSGSLKKMDVAMFFQLSEKAYSRSDLFLGRVVKMDPADALFVLLTNSAHVMEELLRSSPLYIDHLIAVLLMNLDSQEITEAHLVRTNAQIPEDILAYLPNLNPEAPYGS